MSTGVHARARSGRVIQRSRIWPGTWVTLRTGSVGWDLKSQLVEIEFKARPDEFVSGAHLVWGRWKSHVYLSPFVEKPYKLKGNKKFRTVTIPPRHPRHINFFETISLLGRWSTSGSDRGIVHFFIATRNTIKGVGGKRTNEQNTWVNSRCKRGSYVTLHSLVNMYTNAGVDF